MNKKELLYRYIKRIQHKHLLTEFLINIFDYEELHDYNYIFRIIKEDNIIIDIYDNVSNNRFNRYIINYSKDRHKNILVVDNSIYIHYIDVLYNNNVNNNIEKLVYLFSLDREEIIDYAKTFLEDKFVDILKAMIHSIR